MAILLHKIEERETKDIVQVLQVMEKYIFLVFRISRRQSNTGDSEFYRVSKDFYYNILSLNDIILKINDWIFGNDERGRYFDENRFFDYIKDRFEIHKDGFYGWNGLKYILYEYDYSLQESSREEHKKIDWKEFNKEKTNYITIEHIYPQESNQDCWNKFFGRYSKDEKFKLCNSLGNLLPLSQSKNSSLQNDCFDEKKHQVNREVGYFNGSYSENEVAQYGNWTPEEILNRGLKILSFIERRWDIEFGNDEEKKKLLNLEFLN